MIQVKWLKWRKALRVICNCKVPTELEGSFIIVLFVKLYSMVVNDEL